MQQLDLGRATIHPGKPVVAGSYATIAFTYAAGHPVDDTGCVKVAFRYAGDFGVPQFDDPAAPNYCSIRTTGDCRIEPRWDVKGNRRPWGRSLFLKVMGGYLDRGDKIVVVFGDRSGGSPGWQAQSFCEKTFEFKTLVDPIATYEFKELPKSPTLRVIPGKPERAVCIAPSQVTVGQPFAYHLKLEDRWGNPTGKPKKRKHPGFPRPGTHTVMAKDGPTRLRTRSNPIRTIEAPTTFRPYWAEFHGQSEETIGTNTIDDYFAFARDYALVDIASHQGNDFQVTDEFWKGLNNTTRKFYRPGSFATFPGYEWSGNTPLGGDRNVFFASEDGRIVHSCADLLPGKRSAHPTAMTADELFKTLRKRRGPKPFMFAHVGGRYADMKMHDPDIELAVEVHSGWGTFEWLVEDALRRGCRIGVCANSDDHKGRPGASYPGARKFGSLGGLTCVLAKKLDRRSVFEALKARRFYATTGNRCLIDLKLTTGDGREAMMGEVVPRGKGAPRLEVRVAGTAPIENIEARNGLDAIGTVYAYGREDLGNRVKIVWSGAEVRGRARMSQWDGRLRVRGNSIRGVTPVNFWNADRGIARTRANELTWKSVTTGGLAGMILTPAKPDAGAIDIETVQGNMKCAVKSLGLKPRTRRCGGLRKKIEVYRLPARRRSCNFSFVLPITRLRQGDNPIYIRVTQEDGHMAWTSPVYVV